MSKQNKFINKKFLFSVISILLLTLFAFSALQGYSDLETNAKNYQATSLDIIDQRMSSVLIEINNFPRSAGNDILFLSKLFGLKNVINSKTDNSKSLKDLKSNLLEFSKENTVYYQLRYINEFGDEIIKIEFDGENSFVVPDTNLQNKKNSDYFEETMKLDEEEVYISKISLNKINGILDNRGTTENPVYVPIISYATPVFNNKGESKGIIISDVYADYFLEEIRRYGREGEEVFLINEEGYYLANPNRDKEFGFITGKDDNFYEDYVEIIKDDLTINGRNKIETDKFIFTFRYIYPTTSSFEIYKGSERISEDYHWVLVSISEKESMNKMNENLKANYLFSLIFYGFIILIIFGLLFLMYSRRIKK